MLLVRIHAVVALDGYRVRLALTDGTTVERDLSDLLVGPIFDPIRRDHTAFERVRVEAGALVWPNGADLCPDVVIWNGPPPAGKPAISAVAIDPGTGPS